MVKIVKGTLIVNHEDDKATEIDKFVIVLELKNASLSGGEGRVVSRHLTCVRVCVRSVCIKMKTTSVQMTSLETGRSTLRFLTIKG